jgi:O-antigen ligase
LLLGAALAAALTLHVLAYRSGLLVLYVGLLAYGVQQLARKHVAVGLAVLALLVLGPWLAYRSLESVQQRVGATRWDVQQFTQGHDINNYSLARRLAAIETAGTVIGEHWLLGVGPADAHAAMMQQYAWKDYGLRPANRVEVHNQYLRALLGGGLVGLALLLALLFWPLTKPWARRNAALGIFILSHATVMLVDAVFELQIGLNLFVFGYGYLVVAGERRNQVVVNG